MQIHYNSKTDLLYITLDDRSQEVLSKEVGQDILLDYGEDQKLVGIEIMNASKHLSLDQFLPVDYELAKEAV